MHPPRGTGCEFAPRCPEAEAACETWRPEPVALDGGGTAACRRLPVTTVTTDTHATTAREGSVR
ncbi:hypothetical protein OG292_15215 [Streptomyces sp. NBC_01511]|uniref:hypothetical protein n=1 Tax=unclassified Streptomyces TaxID=2593676 RepID=UPI003869344C